MSEPGNYKDFAPDNWKTVDIHKRQHQPWHNRPERGDTVYRDSTGFITYGRAERDGVPFGNVTEVKDTEDGGFVVAWVVYE